MELIGSTGVGKSTLSRQLVGLLTDRGQVVLTSEQCVMRCYGLRAPMHAWRGLASLLVDILSFPWFVAFSVRHLRLCALMFRVAWRDIDPILFRLNVLRNIAKQMGIHELLRRRGRQDEVVILDEGLIHQAHNLFVHPALDPRVAELERFVAEVPMPDLLVLVEAPSKDVVERTIRRGHPRVRHADAACVAAFIGHAQRVFRMVVAQAAQRTSTLEFRNDILGRDRSLCRLLEMLSSVPSTVGRDAPLDSLRNLSQELNVRGVVYCHWKSNASLKQALAGEGDLDLLVDPGSWSTFEAVIRDFGFVATRSPDSQARPGAGHYFGFDEPSGRLVHLDVYTRLITGGTLVKNHRLPLERMLLSSLRPDGGMPVPSRGAELLLLVLRKLLESASVPEHMLLLREYGSVMRELRWLRGMDSVDEARTLLRGWLPCVNPRLFEAGLRALDKPCAVVARHILGRQLVGALIGFQQQPEGRASVERWTRLGRWLVRRMGFGVRGMQLVTQGAVIAFVGTEGSGKSTQMALTAAWLNQAFAVHTMHAGKPPASPLSWVPNLLAPAFRRHLPQYRTTAVEVGSVASPRGNRSIGAWLYRLRCISLAYDRRRLLTTAARLRARGELVICDRYPSAEPGFVDGAQLRDADSAGFLARQASRLERSLYAAIPRPDLVIVCRVPLADALQRNASRQKQGGPEPEDFVRRRYAQFSAGLPSEFQQHIVDTTLPATQTQAIVRSIVWRTIARNQTQLRVN